MKFIRDEYLKYFSLKDRNVGDTPTSPATWIDLVIYIFGGIGIYFSASLIVGLFISEFTIWITFGIALLNFLCLAGSTYIFGLIRGKISWKSMGLVWDSGVAKFALIGTIVAVVILPLRFGAALVGLMVEMLVSGDILSLTAREELLSVGFDSWHGVMLMILGVGILAPVAEELFFRGLLYDWFRQKIGIGWAILVSSLLFGLAHYDSLAVVGSSFVMGLAMAYAYERFSSLWVSIFMHIATNSGAILFMVVVSNLQRFLPDLQY